MSDSENIIKSGANARNGGFYLCDEDSDNNGFKAKIRRTKSVAIAEKFTEGERRIRRAQPDKPVHVTRDSLFSWSSGFNRFEGFINWGALLLFIGGFRLFLENVNKYGIRISPTNVAQWIISENANNSYIHTPLYLLISNVHILATLYVEKLLNNRTLSNRTGVIFHFCHLFSIIVIPVVLLRHWAFAFSLIGRLIICTVHTMYFLKLWSYAQVNYWCRMDKQRYTRKRCHSFKNLNDNHIVKGNISYVPVQYPDNLNIADIYYFMFAPTFCYELNFPRSHTVRFKFLIRRLMEIFILVNIFIGLFQQWIIPSVKNSLKPFSEMDYMKCAERILKLAIPNHLLWLIFFYFLFHSVLNTVGEIMRFGDRNFYQDWWNAPNVEVFWRLWNLPVHSWCVRHLYVPLVSTTHSKFLASIMVFLVSAFFHEYLVSIPLGMYKIEVFLGMLIQVPLISASIYVERFVGPRAGNTMVWASLIIGQPIAIMIYVHDYIILNFDSLNFT